MQQVLSEIFDALRAAYGRENRPGGDAAERSLAAVRPDVNDLSSSGTAPLSLLDAAAGQASALPLAKAVCECAGLFAWQHWAEGELDAEVSSNLYTTELVGPDGVWFDSAVRVGLLISAADTDYPVSSHSGEETYYVISGVAEWTLGDGIYRPVHPGELVHHPAWKPHGRRTLNEVFLGAWRWSGDLDLASFRVDAAAGATR